MPPPRILLIEDNPEEALYLQQTLRGLSFEIAGISHCLDQAWKLYKEKRPDLCVVDIYLDGKPDGVEFARLLGEEQAGAAVVFLTGNHDPVTFYLAKITQPHSYLLKPYNPLELQYAIELAMEKMRRLPIRESDTLFIKRGTQMTKLNIHDIRYVAVEGKYSKIFCTTDRFLVQQPLKDLQNQLPATLFSRIHRNYLVNIAEVSRIDTVSNEVLFKDGTSLAFSRRYLDQLLHYFRILK
jgi:DNA-binding LytR/AlgR family response regulator